MTDVRSRMRRPSRRGIIGLGARGLGDGKRAFPSPSTSSATSTMGAGSAPAELWETRDPHTLVTVIAPNFPAPALTSPPSCKIKRPFVLFCAAQEERRAPPAQAAR